jgi:drug/metabolite transporter (DMT)-like permease
MVVNGRIGALQRGNQVARGDAMDVQLLRIVVLGLVGALFLSLGCVALVAAAGHEPPQALGYVAVGCFSTLAGIVINPKGNGNGAAPKPPPPAP